MTHHTGHPTITLGLAAQTFILRWPDGHQKEISVHGPTAQALAKLLRPPLGPVAIPIPLWPYGLRVSFHPIHPSLWHSATFWDHSATGPPLGTVVAQQSPTKPTGPSYVVVLMDHDQRHHTLPPEFLRHITPTKITIGLSLDDLGL